jgi:phage terminase large subunit-like protein
MKLHELFALLMKTGGIRKSEIARDIGVTWSAAHQWITGATVPDTQNMAELQDILGIRNLRYSDDRDVITYELVEPRHRRAGGSSEISGGVASIGTQRKQPSSTPRQQLPALVLAAKKESENDGGEDRLRDYRPYPKQQEFHAAGREHRERLFMAGNQLGKTLAGGAEWAMHLTGRYPDWWRGRVFDKPVRMWVAGVTSESTRDNPQRILIGPPEREEAWGKGMIPKPCIRDHSTTRGVSNALDSVVIRWGGGGDVEAGHSMLGFKSYEKGREKWQGETLDGVWFDEEPPLDIYSEGLTRTNATGGITIVTFTPLLGMSEVVLMFLAAEQVEDMMRK